MLTDKDKQEKLKAIVTLLNVSSRPKSPYLDSVLGEPEIDPDQKLIVIKGYLLSLLSVDKHKNAQLIGLIPYINQVSEAAKVVENKKCRENYERSESHYVKPNLVITPQAKLAKEASRTWKPGIPKDSSRPRFD